MTDEYIDRKVGRGSNFNYDLFPLIRNFSFEDLTEYPKYIKDEEGNAFEDYGAFFIITDKQYIIGYTAGNGAGTHKSAFARVQKEIQGGGVINNFGDAKELIEKCMKNNICARIYYCNGIYNNRPDYNGHIDIDLTDTIITKNKFEIFKLLYDKYNEELLYLASKNKSFQVEYTYLEGNRVLRNESNSLDSLYLYFQNNLVDDNKVQCDSEIIIGETIKKITK